MSSLGTSRVVSVLKGVLTTTALALSLNIALPAPQAQAGLLGGALGGAVIGGIVGGRRGAGVGAVVGGVAGAIQAGDRRRAEKNYVRRELAYERGRRDAERRRFRR